MATSLTGSAVNATYSQLLHIDGGPTAAEKTVYSGTGTVTALKLGTTSLTLTNATITGGTMTGITSAIITGGSVTGITDITVADGGTGASTAAGARTNLGLGTISTQAASAVAITGGTIAGVTTLGASAAAITGGTMAGVAITNGSALVATSLGFNTGAGGAVTQATSKATGVTLNKPCGAITLHAASLAATTSVSFTLTNSSIAARDVVVVSIASGATAASYLVVVGAVASGSCLITLRNYTGGALAEAVVLNFVVIKAVNA